MAYRSNDSLCNHQLDFSEQMGVDRVQPSFGCYRLESVERGVGFGHVRRRPVRMYFQSEAEVPVTSALLRAKSFW